jgi:glutathione S-transferase
MLGAQPAGKEQHSLIPRNGITAQMVPPGLGDVILVQPVLAHRARIEHVVEPRHRTTLIAAGVEEADAFAAVSSGAAGVKRFAQAIACDIHPLNNLRVLKYLTGTLGASEDAKNAWYRHWIELGLAAIEARLAADRRTGDFCHGATPTLADICLVPQLANARRYDFSIEAYPTLGRIESNCLALDAFARAAPARQPDAA